MKTLQEIIERTDYIRINAALKERAYELAEKIRSKYEQLYPIWDAREDELPAYAVDVDGRWYTVRYNLNGQRETEGTTLCVFPDWTDKKWWSLENQKYRVYSTDTPSAVFTQFLNDAQKILSELDSAETELCANVKKALDASANL